MKKKSKLKKTEKINYLKDYSTTLPLEQFYIPFQHIIRVVKDVNFVDVVRSFHTSDNEVKNGLQWYEIRDPKLSFALGNLEAFLYRQTNLRLFGTRRAARKFRSMTFSSNPSMQIFDLYNLKSNKCTRQSALNIYLWLGYRIQTTTLHKVDALYE